jgi:hypothetical protein
MNRDDVNGVKIVEDGVQLQTVKITVQGNCCTLDFLLVLKEVAAPHN